MRRVLILGARGMLGSQLVRLFPEGIGWDREDVDVLDRRAFESSFRESGALDAVINCVAFNDVDGAEERPEAAAALNAEFPGRLAELCDIHGIPLVHYSTNYVFDGVKGDYAEQDSPSPLSVYGRSKLGGELSVIHNSSRHYVVRTAVIFGPKGASELSKRSFVELVMDLSSRRDMIQAVDDEINSVTYAPDLAMATRRLLESGSPYGVYHLTNQGSASWYDLAARIFELTERRPRLVAVPGSTFPRKALRPAKAVLMNTRAPQLRHWHDALAEFAGGS